MAEILKVGAIRVERQPDGHISSSILCCAASASVKGGDFCAMCLRCRWGRAVVSASR